MSIGITAGASLGSEGAGKTQTPASGGASAPAGATAHLKLDDAEVGAFPSTANQGSISENWTRNGSDITVASGGPNGMKYATKTTSNDYLKLGTQTVADIVSAAAGTMGFIFKLTLDGDSPFAQGINNARIFSESLSSLLISSFETPQEIVPFYRGGTLNQHVHVSGYTTETWRALVVRWERGSVNKLFAKLDGDSSWTEVTLTQDLFSAAGTLELMASSGETNQIAEFLTYQSQSEEDGDALMDYLTTRAGL